MAETTILHEVAVHFARYPRPAAFINRLHCDECAEHYETLLHVTVEQLSHDHTGDGAWDPTAMLTPDAFKYYFPGLARIADQLPYWRDMFTMRFATHYTDTFTREDWAMAGRLLEHWWLDESLHDYDRHGLERALDTCRAHLRD